MSHASSPPAWEHVIGIIGGLGPYAHVEFETLLLGATATAIGRAPTDQDYPSWVLSSLPRTPDRTNALLANGASPVDALVRSAARLTEADFAVIPCNTAHAFLPDVRRRVALPILDMIEATAEEAVSTIGPSGTIGLLAATGTLRSKLYQDAIERIDPALRTLSPLELNDGEQMQARCIMEPIFGEAGIKAGAYHDPKRRDELKETMQEAVQALRAAGADLVLTACTEIPLVLGRGSVCDTPLLDPMAVAAERAIAIAIGRRPLPTLPEPASSARA